MKHENHPSIIKIKKLAKTNESFTFPKVKTEDINKMINSLNRKKATGHDGIPTKVIKTASKIVDSHLNDAINHHCVKSVRIRSFFGPYFHAFGLNTEKYGVSLRIQPEYKKIRTRKNHAVQDIELNSCSGFAKVASVRSLYNKEETCKIKNYLHISILNPFSNLFTPLADSVRK